MYKGYLCLVLHGHLPFVRHPECDYFLEENWLYEAITETYIPLILMMERLINEGIDFRLTMSLTPPLIFMLKDSLLQERYLRHINKLIELSHKEIERTRWQPQFQKLALMYLDRFLICRETFERYKRDLVSAFKSFAGKRRIRNYCLLCYPRLFTPDGSKPCFQQSPDKSGSKCLRRNFWKKTQRILAS